MSGIENGYVRIVPFDKKYINPNSYDVHLGGNLAYELVSIDSEGGKYEPKYKTLNWAVDSDGREFIRLHPGILYLFSTIESTTSTDYVPCIDGCSSLARMGVSIHETAGFGDFGWGYDTDLRNASDPVWTLEVSVKVSMKLYKGMRIAQVYFQNLLGPRNIVYGSRGRYNSQKEPQPTLNEKYA